jgi:hypothetical protein
MRCSFILGLSVLLASLPVAAEPEPQDLFAPALYAGVSFGGAGGASEPRVGLRLDGARLPAGASAPALMQWELRPAGAQLAVAGRTLLATGAPAPGYAESGEPPSRAGGAIAAGLLGTAAVVGVVAWALGEFSEDFGEAFGEAVVEGFTPQDSGSSDDGSDDKPTCTGIELGEECLGGS